MLGLIYLKSIKGIKLENNMHMSLPLGHIEPQLEGRKKYSFKNLCSSLMQGRLTVSTFCIELLTP
jgi:hypothetical protein